MLIKKLKEWFKRYSLAEIIALSFAIISTNLSMNLSMILFDNIVLAAFIGTWADNLGYFLTIIVIDLRKKLKTKKKLIFKDIKNQIKNMIIEFGPAECLDSFIVRPFYLSIFPLFISNYSLAILIGSLLANITYYIPAIIGYEHIKRRKNKQE